MQRVAHHTTNFMAVAALLAAGFAGSVSAQEQVVEYGRIVQADDGTGSMGYLVGYEGDVRGEAKKPWLPLLSPLMIHLDCWITRMVNINDFYSQQAADEYFAMAESCADIPLSMDPNINMGLKWTVLSPIYAWCPDLLNRRGILGGCGGYGIPSPMPSVAGYHPSAAGHHISAPAAPSEMNLQPIPRAGDIPGGVGVELGSPVSSAPSTPASGSGQNFAGNRWSNMSDEQILAHFGLDPSVAARSREAAEMDGSKLDRPVAEAQAWQFADEAPTVPLDRRDMVALNHETYPPRVEAVVWDEPVIVDPVGQSVSIEPAPNVGEEHTIELEFNDPQASPESRPAFSSTDSEYDRMREIERDLLGY